MAAVLFRSAENKNQSEAEYRYVLTRLRENGESIALLGGEEEERAGVDKALEGAACVARPCRAAHAYHRRFSRQRTTRAGHSGADMRAEIPGRQMSLGEVMQAASAFVIVQPAFSWLVDNYPRFADWTASARRVGSLLVSLDSLERAEEAGVGYIQRSREGRGRA